MFVTTNCVKSTIRGDVNEINFYAFFLFLAESINVNLSINKGFLYDTAHCVSAGYLYQKANTICKLFPALQEVAQSQFVKVSAVASIKHYSDTSTQYHSCSFFIFRTRQNHPLQGGSRRRRRLATSQLLMAASL